MQRRQYIRIPSVLPVQIAITNRDKNIVWKTIFQGFTRDINEAGVCLEVNNLDDSLVDKLNNSEYLFSLTIDLPNREHPLKVFAEPRWLQKVEDGNIHRYKIGVLFLDINEHDVKAIIKFAYRLHRKPKQMLGLVLFFIMIGMVSFFDDLKLRYDNARLSKEIENVRIENERIEQELNRIHALQQDLEINLLNANTEIEKLTKILEKPAQIDVQKYEQQIAKLQSDKIEIEKQLKNLLQKEVVLKEKKQIISKIDTTVSNKKVNALYGWVKDNQVLKTGLVHSYQGDADLESMGFTYDQALAIMNFIEMKEFDRARKIIDFFVYKARRKNSGYLNAYNVNMGNVMEWTAHVGPNAWLGMAILKYIEVTGDRTYLQFAESIAKFILSMQDPDGGIKGGEDVAWYSTEHNIDAHAFFRMLNTLTDKIEYKNASDRIMYWLKNQVYLQNESRFMRGQKDYKIATDTVSFGIPAIGVQTLYDNGIEPEKLITFIEENTKVTTKFKNDKGQILEITGFDYTKPQDIGREGVVSSEWTAQMVITYQVMAEYFKNRDEKKFEYYRNLAKFYSNELDKMLLVPSHNLHIAGLPYASSEYVDTGHGWITPKNPYAISIAGTAYTLLAYKQANPFALDQEKSKYYS